MRTRDLVLLILVGFLLMAPAVSFTLKTVMADTLEASADTIVATEDTVAGQMPGKAPLVYTMKIDGAIGTVTDERIGEAIDIADQNGAALLVIYLDTPGGFTKPTWSICKKILNSPVPVCIYIAPAGARAGSAGVYMTYTAHFAAMASSTNIGAAHPVAGGGQEIDSVMNEKITNDAVAQIKAAADKRGRNAEWAEKSVRESASITVNEALELNVIDIKADNIDDLLSQIDGRDADLPDGVVVMNLKNAEKRELDISFVHIILELITQPDIAFILFSIGSLGLMLELYNPGAIFPGVVGAISLILAFYAFQTLPINYAGVALILLAIVLFIAEIKIISHGLLTVGGIISLFLGGLMLIDTVDPSLAVSTSVLITMVVCVGVVVLGAGYFVLKASGRQPTTGPEGMIGKIAEVRGGGMIYVDGALWKMACPDELANGEKVSIIGSDNLTLKVKKINSKEG